MLKQFPFFQLFQEIFQGLKFLRRDSVRGNCFCPWNTCMEIVSAHGIHAWKLFLLMEYMLGNCFCSWNTCMEIGREFIHAWKLVGNLYMRRNFFHARNHAMKYVTFEILYISMHKNRCYAGAPCSEICSTHEIKYGNAFPCMEIILNFLT